MAILDVAAQYVKDNAYVALALAAISIIGLPISVILYWRGKRDPKLVYYSHSTNLFRRLDRAGSKVSAQIEGIGVKSLTVSRVAVWNDGLGTIRREDISPVDPLRIEAGGDAEIYEVQVIKQSQPAVGAAFLPSRDRKMVTLSFDMLNSGQGALLHVVHSGETGHDIFVTGTVARGGAIQNRGQAEMRTLARAILWAMPSRRRNAKRLFSCITLLLGVASLTGAVLLSAPKKFESIPVAPKPGESGPTNDPNDQLEKLLASNGGPLRLVSNAGEHCLVNVTRATSEVTFTRFLLLCTGSMYVLFGWASMRRRMPATLEPTDDA